MVKLIGVDDSGMVGQGAIDALVNSGIPSHGRFTDLSSRVYLQERRSKSLRKVSYPSYWWASYYQEDKSKDLWGKTLSDPATAGYVIINPNSGPGDEVNPDWATQADIARTSGATVLGYISTDYANKAIARDGSRTHNTIVAEARKYSEWYSVDGFFLDETSNGWSDEQAEDHVWYEALTNLLRGEFPNAHFIGNAGANTRAEYLPLFDVLVTFEKSAEEYLAASPQSLVPEHYKKEGPGKFWHMIHDVTSEDQAREVLEKASQSNVSNIYLTDDSNYHEPPAMWGNPYDVPPADWLLDMQRKWVRGISLTVPSSGGEAPSVPTVGTPMDMDPATGEPVYPVPDSRQAIQDALNEAANGGERTYWAFLEQRGGHVKMAPGTYYLSAPESGNPSLVIPRGVTFDFSEANLVFAYPSSPTTNWSAILFKSQSGLVLGRMSTFGNAPDSAHVYDAIRVWHTDNYNRITGTPHAKISSFRGAVIRTLGAYVVWAENFRAAFCSHGIIHGESNGLVPAGTAPYDWPTSGVGGEAVGPARRPTDLWVKNAQFDGIRGNVFVVGAVGSVDNPNGIKGDAPTDPTDTVTGGNLHLDTVLVEGCPARVIRARHLSQIVTRDLHIEEVGAPSGPIFDLDVVYGIISMRDTRFNTSMQRSVQKLDGNTTKATPNRMFSLGFCRQFIVDGMYIQNSGSDMTFAVESWGGAWDTMKYQVSGLAHDPANTGHMQPGALLKAVDESNFITNALPASATSTTFVEDPAGSGTYRMVN